MILLFDVISSIVSNTFVLVHQVWRVDGSAKTPLLKEDVGKFYSGDCHIVLYTYHAGDRKEDYFLCYWIGEDSSEVCNSPTPDSQTWDPVTFLAGFNLLFHL